MKFKRTLSLVLAIILLCTIQCVSAFAVEQADAQALLVGTFNDWQGSEMTLAEGSVYTTTAQLEAGNYMFRVKYGDSEFGHPGTVKDTTANVSAEGFMLSDAVNSKCTLVATGGSYTFSFNAVTNMLKVIKDGVDTSDTQDDTLKVNFADASVEAEVGGTVTYNVYLAADEIFEDIQSVLSYNSKKLSLKKAEFESADAEAAASCPNIANAVYNSELSGVVAVNASDVNGYDFTEENLYLTLEFDVIAGGETALEFTMQEMTKISGEDYYTYSNLVTEGALVREEVLVEAKPSVADVNKYSVTLGTNIALNFYMNISDDLANSSRARLVFTLPNGSQKAIYVKDATITDDGLYMFTCELAAKEMASEVKAQLVTADFRSEVFAYSVKEYAEHILNSNDAQYDDAKPLVKAMLNYGANAQVYFNYNADTLANESLTDDEKALAEVDLSEYRYKLEGEQEGVTYYGSKLTLESETAIKHYFIFEDADNIPLITVNGEEVAAKKKGSYYEVKIADILAQNLDEKVVVKVGGLSLDYNALSYAELSMRASDVNLKNVMKALCVYNAEADAYIG